MANLSDEVLIKVANLLTRLFTVINLATATEYQLFEQYGENEQTLPELEQISNATERARTSYNRLYGLVLQVAESQPIASSRLINLLDQSIERAQATADAVEATALESKQVWNLL
jgi:hypothetical protein